jgi:hypothetical protein
MKIKTFLLIGTLIVCSVSVNAQKAHPKPVIKTKQIIFAIIYDGTGIEPIASVINGKLVASSADEDNVKGKSFASRYYKPNSKYGLIFGGGAGGMVTIKSSNIGKECGGVSAEVSVQSMKTKLNGFIMSLATDFKPKTKIAYRRKPTPAERSEIEDLVRAEYLKQKVSAKAIKDLHYYNLTALDIDNDGKAEFIGSYWVAPKTDERDLLFFIAEMNASGKYSFTHSEYSAVKPDGLMSGDVKDLDTMGGELLLDMLDYDNDGVSEIFTIGKAFEGNNYYVYKSVSGKWKKVFDTYDYRCGY